MCCELWSFKDHGLVTMDTAKNRAVKGLKQVAIILRILTSYISLTVPARLTFTVIDRNSYIAFHFAV